MKTYQEAADYTTKESVCYVAIPESPHYEAKMPEDPRYPGTAVTCTVIAAAVEAPRVLCYTPIGMAWWIDPALLKRVA